MPRPSLRRIPPGADPVRPADALATSFAPAEDGAGRRRAVPSGEGSDIAPRGFALSAGFHLALIAALIVGLPSLFSPPPPEQAPIAVKLVTMAPETRATHPNPAIPKPEAKPEIAKLEAPAPKPEAKPEPPKPSPTPPAAAAPPEPKPPAEPKPAVKPSEPKPTETAAPPLLPEPKPEPPKPIQKPEPPKPLEKPRPPQQTARSEQKPDQKKYEVAKFDALLKNLVAQDNTPAPEAQPQRPQRSAATPSSQPKAPLGAQMSASEIDMIREQISHCWNIPAGARDAKDLVVEIRVVLDRDGGVRQATIVDQGREARDPFFRAAAESARRAFYNPMCKPLHGLPPEKYDIWKDLVVTFNPRDML